MDFKAAQKAEQAATKKAEALRAQAYRPASSSGRWPPPTTWQRPRRDLRLGRLPEGLSERAYLTQNQATAVQALQKQIKRAEDAQRDAEAKTAQVKKAWDDAKNRAEAKAKVTEVMKRLDKLSTTHARDPRTGLTATIKGSDLPAKMARKAYGKIGSPYVWPPPDSSSFDCSGLVVWAYAQVGKPGLPHYTGDLYQLGTKVSRGQLRSGDLVYFGSNLHHMGIYLSGGSTCTLRRPAMW